MTPRNGRHHPQRPRIELTAPANATPDEAAAISAAIDGFLRDTAPPPQGPAGPAVSPWARAARFESAGLAAEAPSPLGDPDPWGRA